METFELDVWARRAWNAVVGQEKAGSPDWAHELFVQRDEGRGRGFGPGKWKIGAGYGRLVDERAP